MKVDEGEIGDTPIVKIEGVGEREGVNIYAKVEWFNLHSTPYGGGSVKSRPALYMIDRAEKLGELNHDKTIIEPTSGNTGSEIAKIATYRGYDVLIVMPDNAGEGKIKTIKAAGGDIELVDALKGYDAVIERAEEILEENPEKYYMPDQYRNPANPLSHKEGTAKEIKQQIDDIDYFIAGVGTGGTITGVSRGLKEKNTDIIAVEPDSPMHAIDGLKYLGEGHYIPDIFDKKNIDKEIEISTDNAYKRARQIRDIYSNKDPKIIDKGQYTEETIRKKLRVDENLLIGTSCGANIEAAVEISEEDSNTVIVFADRGDKYKNSLWRDFFDLWKLGFLSNLKTQRQD